MKKVVTNSAVPWIFYDNVQQQKAMWHPADPTSFTGEIYLTFFTFAFSGVCLKWSARRGCLGVRIPGETLGWSQVWAGSSGLWGKEEWAKEELGSRWLQESLSARLLFNLRGWWMECLAWEDFTIFEAWLANADCGSFASWQDLVIAT